jgi:hypothetical protein
MIGVAIVEVILCVRAEGKSLESVSMPLYGHREGNRRQYLTR